MIATLSQPPSAQAAGTGYGCLPDHLSASSIKDYLGCPRRYYFGRVARIPKPVPPALHLGKSVHEAIRHFNLAVWRGLNTSTEAVLAAFDVAFAGLEEKEGPVAYANQGERRDLQLSGRALVTAFINSEAAIRDERPVGVEVRVEERFEGIPVPLVGYIDYVRPGNIPVDYKTVGVSPNPGNEAWGHQIQLTAYQLMIARATGQDVAGLELVFLVKTKIPKVVRLALPPADEAQIGRFRAMVCAVVDGLWEERFHPQPGMHCNWCQYRAECSQWKGAVR